MWGTHYCITLISQKHREFASDFDPEGGRHFPPAGDSWATGPWTLTHGARGWLAGRCEKEKPRLCESAPKGKSC